MSAWQPTDDNHESYEDHLDREAEAHEDTGATPHVNPGPGPCGYCGKPATCYGVYENPCRPVTRACDDCCGHGREDGWCSPFGGDCIDCAHAALSPEPEPPA